ncbi:hypothetical protein [Actinosynnema sp. NPDC020468]|uniref:hypothetical protein n=1 Tax=Actinosynnema sp. NPDC020468 TaxID=3154488 RepID=UPI0033CB152B
MTDERYLVAETSSGDRWDDPSEDLLYMLVEDIVDERGGSFLLRRIHPREGDTLEVSSLDGRAFRVVRADDDGVFEAHSGEPREVHAAITHWSFERADGAAYSRLGWRAV